MKPTFKDYILIISSEDSRTIIYDKEGNIAKFMSPVFNKEIRLIRIEDNIFLIMSTTKSETFLFELERKFFVEKFTKNIYLFEYIPNLKVIFVEFADPKTLQKKFVILDIESRPYENNNESAFRRYLKDVKIK